MRRGPTADIGQAADELAWALGQRLSRDGDHDAMGYSWTRDYLDGRGVHRPPNGPSAGDGPGR